MTTHASSNELIKQYPILSHITQNSNHADLFTIEAFGQFATNYQHANVVATVPEIIKPSGA